MLWKRQTGDNHALKLREWHPFTGSGVQCLIIVGVVKLLFFFLDPLPKFFQGDSFSYLSTAINGWIPPDRSFVYGFMIRGLTICSHSLTPLIAAQCLASFGTCMLVYHIVRDRFGLSHKLATTAACCCAFDPMQLYYERAVMTEAFSTFFFALCIATALQYAAAPRLRTLLFLTLSCMIPISLRVTFVLPTIGICLLPPLFLLVEDSVFHAAGATETLRSRMRRMIRNFRRSRYLGHLAAACACMFMLHFGYCHTHGKMKFPAYIRDDGFFQIAGLAPIITPADATDPRVAKVIASFNEASLRDRNMCGVHIFCPQGLAGRLKAVIGNPQEAAALAKAVAMNAVRRAPVQTAMLGFRTWLDYFNYAKMKPRLLNEQGADITLFDSEIETLQTHFSLAATKDWALRPTVTKWMHLHLRMAYYILLAAPFFAVAALGSWRKNPLAVSLFFMSTMTLLATTCVFSHPDLRYLHPFGFLAPPLIAVAWNQFVRWRKTGKLQPEVCDATRQSAVTLRNAA